MRHCGSCATGNITLVRTKVISVMYAALATSQWSWKAGQATICFSKANVALYLLKLFAYAGASSYQNPKCVKLSK